MPFSKTSFEHLKDGWNDQKAKSLDPVNQLVYRSNLLGQDWRITNTNGGNTSSKLTQNDPLTGEKVKVLWVKGSGSDLGTADREDFASLYQDKLVDLQERYASFENRGKETQAEDRIIDLYQQCTFNGNSTPPSIDTPLHSFIPYKCVDHTHPVACLAIATAEDGRQLTREIFQGDVAWLDWQRPGFELGLALQELCEKHSETKGAILGGHGLINWANDEKECYRLTLSLIKKATQYVEGFDQSNNVFGETRYQSPPAQEQSRILREILPWLRGKLSQEKRVIATVHRDASVMEFVNSENAPRIAEQGTSCPDHFIRTRIKPLLVDWDPQTEDVATLKRTLDKGLSEYREDYAAYYKRHQDPHSPPMRGTNPTVVLIPGVGMITWGKNKRESRITAELYNAAMRAIRGAESVSNYTAISRREAFDIEYWRLEEAKIQRRPAEKELARQVVAVIGAGSGIGREATRRLREKGASVAALDIDGTAAERTADEISEDSPKIREVGGSGISGCGDVIGLHCDITSRSSLREALQKIIIAYGGLDHLVVTAGYYPTPHGDESLSEEDWRKTFDVHVTGSYLAAQEIKDVWKTQKLSGSMVLVTSVNGVVPKTRTPAYDTSKAAANHLVRELALELAPHVRVNGVAPAAVVEGSSMFHRERVQASLDKYNIPYNDTESDESLRQRLADFYAERTLTKQAVTPKAPAEAIYLLVSDRLDKTTGQILTVDGGLEQAFLR